MNEPVMSDILQRELERMRSVCGYGSLDTLQSGMARNRASEFRTGDSWSTVTFTDHATAYAGTHTGIDLDVSHALSVLGPEVMGGVVELIQADTVKGLEFLAHQGRGYDVILLDSFDDPYRILREYLLALGLIRHPGLIAVDDVACHPDSYGAKGDAVVPYLKENGTDFRVSRRWNGRTWIDVVLIDFPADTPQET